MTAPPEDVRVAFAREFHEAFDKPEKFVDSHGTPKSETEAVAIKHALLFEHGVDVLRNHLPNPHLNQLGRLLWDVVGHRVTPVMSGLPVPSVTFIASGTKDGKELVRAGIMLPPTYQQLVTEDPVMQMGAIVYNGSKAIDFYRKKPLDGWNERAAAWESEYLLTVQKTLPNQKFNDYQKHVMMLYPQGIRSEKAKGVVYAVGTFDG